MSKINREEVEILTKCPICGEEKKIYVNFEDWIDWTSGTSVQVAFPYLSADEREQIISGICPTCWARMFS